MPHQRIFVAGHNGMVGGAITRQLSTHANVELVLRTRAELDLCDQAMVQQFFNDESIDAVYLAAAKVGGIHANSTYPAEFIQQNLTIQTNIIHSAYLSGIKKLLFLGSSCIYPRNVSQPMSENALLSGYLEHSNEPYAIAKIAGIKMCDAYNRQYGVDYRSVMPTNLYGPGDNFHPENSHVVPAMIRRFHEAKVSKASSVVLWGSGTPFREFLHVEDMASASIYVMNLEKERLDTGLRSLNTSDGMPAVTHINIGTGKDCTIAELAETVAEVVGYTGELVWDRTRPDGTPRKLLDVSLINSLGWQPDIELRAGLVQSYEWFQSHVAANS